jgi:MHS family proline/betaine transporter-like MFS transporter
VAPTFEVAGVWGSVIIVVARLLQGFSCGGELGGGTAILAESAPDGRRGLYASWQSASQVAGFLLGSLTNLAVISSMDKSQLEAGGWRVPFLVGLLIVPVGFYIRARLDESPLFIRMRHTQGHCVMRPQQARAAMVAAGLTVLYVAAPYVLFVYMPTFAVKQMRLAMPEALLAGVVAASVALALCPVFGAFSDRVGRRPIMLSASVALAALAYPAFELLTRAPGLLTLAAVQTAFGVLTVAYAAPANSSLTECFTTRVRSTSMALVYNIIAAVVGGFAQFIVIWLIAVTGNPSAPAFYVIGAAGIAAASTWILRDAYREALR